MSIKYADILEFLKGDRGLIAKLSKDTGINRYRLYKWKDGKGEPSGDEMILLYEMVKSHMTETQPEIVVDTRKDEPGIMDKYIARMEHDIRRAERSLERAEDQIETLVETNAQLTNTIISKISSLIAAGNKGGKLQTYKEDIVSRTRTQASEQTEEEQQKIGGHIDSQG